MAIEHLAAGIITGLSTDTKPLPALTTLSSTFTETDTRKRYYNSGTAWILQEHPQVKEFNVYKVGTTTYVTDQQGKIQQSNSDTQVAVQAQLDSIANNQVFTFIWDGDLFTLNLPIIFPVSTSGIIKAVKMIGKGHIGQRLTTGTVACLQPSATFPTDRYIFELNNAGASNANTGHVTIENFQANNLNNFTPNFNGVNVGFVKIEAGNTLNGHHSFIVRNLKGDYMWRMLHLIGGVWFGLFENIISYEVNATFLGDSVITLEDGGHTGAINPTPKTNTFRNIIASHGAGQFNSFLRIKSGGYNTFSDCFTNGHCYKSATYNLDNTDTLALHNNTFRDNTVIDLLLTPSPDNRQANLYLAGTNVQDNIFRNHRCAIWPVTVKLAGTGVKSNDIEIPAYFGGVSSVTDTGTDATNPNTIRLTPGNRISGTNTAITHTGGISTIIDDRKGSRSSGNTFFSGTGAQTVFTIPHGIFKQPAWVSVDPGSTAIVSIPFWYTYDTTNITVTFASAPPSGSNNITLRWRAEAY